MSKRTLTIEHGDKTLYGTIGRVTSTTLGYEDHGIMTASLLVEWKGGGVSVGGFVLDDYDKAIKKRVGTAFGMDHVTAIMRTVGVSSWEQIKGKELIVLFESSNSWGSRAVGIASLSDENEVLVFQEHADAWRERHPKEGSK